MGPRGLMVLALDCGATGPQFESRSPLFFREQPSTYRRRNGDEEEGTPVNDHLMREHPRNRGSKTKDFKREKTQ